MILPFDYIGYKRLSENKRFPNHRWYSDATWKGNGWIVSILYKQYFKPPFVTKTLQLTTANANNEGWQQLNTDNTRI
jgi:hypothetical protein